MAKLRFNGVKKKRATWSSMGKVYSYNLKPGSIIDLPENQVGNVGAFGSFVRLDVPVVAGKTVVNKKTIEKEDWTKKTVKPPVVEDVVEDIVEEVVEEIEVAEEVEDEEMIEDSPVEDIAIDYTSFNKKSLKTMCKERGISVSGNRDDLIANLVSFDLGVILPVK